MKRFAFAFTAVASALATLALATPLPEPLAVAYRVRAYFRAGGVTAGLGGFAPSDNLPVPTPREYQRSVALTIRAEPETSQTWGDHAGFKVVIVNGTEDDLAFEATDSLLYVVRQAQDTHGAWRDVEYVPHSWCGNSYHSVTLPAGNAWLFTAPRYHGPMPTKMRFRAETPLGTIYSNAFLGTINAAQFDEKQGHTRTGVMDPYSE